jgi:hypothetical protein
LSDFQEGCGDFRKQGCAFFQAGASQPKNSRAKVIDVTSNKKSPSDNLKSITGWFPSFDQKFPKLVSAVCDLLRSIRALQITQ